MLQLVRFGQGVHVYDTEKRRFVKSTARRIAAALGGAGHPGSESQSRTRKQMLQAVDWVRCPGCELGKIKKNKKNRPERSEQQPHLHWLVGAYRRG